MRLQGTGWLRLDPMALRMTKLDYLYRCRADPQRMFSRANLRNSNDLQPARQAGKSPASSGSPERLAGFRKRRFTRDSDIVEQPIIQQAQVLPSLPAHEPGFHGSDTTQQHA